MGRSSELDGLTTLPELLVHSIRKWGDREALRQYDRATSQFPTGQGGFEQVGRIHRPFTGARAYDGVQLINK